MNAPTGTNQDVIRYLAAVRDRLGDHPQADELLEDLEQHLTEVAAETEGDLTERLGAPPHYAAEFLASAGVAVGETPTMRARLAALVRDLPPVRLAEDVRRRVTGDERVAAASRALRDAQPGWWFVRAYLLAMGWSLLFEPWGLLAFPWPRFGGRRVLGLVLLAVLMVVSVRVGRQARASRRHRFAGSGLTVLALLALLQIGGAVRASAARPVFQPAVEESAVYGGYGHAEGALTHPDGRPITNLYPYDGHGRPLEDVLLYDQDGNPIDLVVRYDHEGRPIVTSYPVDTDGRPVTNAFPQRQAVRDDARGGPMGERGRADGPEPQVPRLSPGPSPESSPGPSPESSPGPSPESSPGPSGNASPSPSPAPTEQEAGQPSP